MPPRPDETIPEKMAREFSLPIRGSSSKPKGYMSGDTVQYTPEQVEGPTPDQGISWNIAQAQLSDEDLNLIKSLSLDQKVWDTIIVCSLLSGPFGIPMSNAEIAKAINIRDERKDSPNGAHIVENMFACAQKIFFQEHYPETCRYQKWEAARNKLVSPIWQGIGEDKEIKEAFTLWFEAQGIVKRELFLEEGFRVLNSKRRL